MIRFFTALCKLKLEKLSDADIFLNAATDYRHHSGKCPCCGAIGRLSPYCSYYRNLVSYKNGCVIDECVRIDRFICSSCGVTHALLPDILIPYSPYSLRFRLTALLAYLERKTTVAAVCEHFGIAVSTLYRWIRTLLHHKDLLLGAVASRKEPASLFLKNLFGSEFLSNRLRVFYQRFAFSFMQNRPITATYSRPP